MLTTLLATCRVHADAPLCRRRRYLISTALSQPTALLRHDRPGVVGPRDDLRCEVIEDLIAQEGRGKGEERLRQLRWLFGREEEEIEQHHRL